MSPDEIITAISRLNGPDLERVREAVERRREQVVKQSSVVERRNHGSGILQLEYRSNPKTGTRRVHTGTSIGGRKAASTAYTWARPPILKRCLRRSSLVKIRSYARKIGQGVGVSRILSPLLQRLTKLGGE